MIAPLGTEAHSRLRPLGFAVGLLITLFSSTGGAQNYSSNGRWTGISPSTAIGTNQSARTAIHMALLRGDANWASDTTTFHSYLR